MVPVSLNGRQIVDAFGEGTLLAAYQDIIEGETEAQVNFHTINLDTVRRIVGHEDEKVTLHNYLYDRSDDREILNQLEKIGEKNIQFASTSHFFWMRFML